MEAAASFGVVAACLVVLLAVQVGRLALWRGKMEGVSVTLGATWVRGVPMSVCGCVVLVVVLAVGGRVSVDTALWWGTLT